MVIGGVIPYLDPVFEHLPHDVGVASLDVQQLLDMDGQLVVVIHFAMKVVISGLLCLQNL